MTSKARAARESKAMYATNTIAVTTDLLAQIDALCRELAITREEFLREAVNTRARKTRRVEMTRSQNADTQTHTHIRAEWEQKRRRVKIALRDSYGAWARRDDIGDTARWVRQLRRESRRRLKRSGVE